MDTQLAPWAAALPQGQRAAEIVQRCVHCGFCTATCPTYQLLGDELDGPRGRIYLIKQMLEGAEVTRETQTHLDRCLTCRSCETTCPSGVRYGELVDIGRELVEDRVRRPAHQALMRWLLRVGLTSPLFAPGMALGRLFRPLLPRALQDKIPLRRRLPLPDAQTMGHAAADLGSPVRTVLVPQGCVQPSLLPSIDQATLYLMRLLGIQTLSADRSLAPQGDASVQGSGCCGALKHHLADTAGALDQVRRNVAAWGPVLAADPSAAVLMNASGCAVMVKDYGHLLAGDPVYAEHARLVSARCLDPIELLEPYAETLKGMLAGRTDPLPRVAYHAPCTQQHGLKIKGRVESFLSRLGLSLSSVPNSHLCCGSAGTYSVLQPELSAALKDQKLESLMSGQPDLILSANIGCLTHLASGAERPVWHWLEWLASELGARASQGQPPLA